MTDAFQGEVTVAWDDARAANQANWDDRAAIHQESYGLESFDDPTRISAEIRKDLPVLLDALGRDSLDGLEIAHLQCHIGHDTLSLARCGATMTGLDFSADSLAVAKDLADRLNTPISWVQSDVLNAAEAIGKQVDVVYTSVGTITWFEDLATWAQQIAKLLKPGGVFFIRDAHPMLFTVDDTATTPTLKYRYFPNGQALHFNDPGTYLGDGQVEHTRTYEYPHSISEILTALLNAGLTITRFDEHQDISWQYADLMIQNDQGRYEWPGHLREIIPCEFTLVASR